ncbi:MAG TPA: hypothetical protein VGM44_09435 [Polyangiaceae bacterium]
MRFIVCVLAFLPLAACLQIGMPGDSSSGSASGGSAGASADAGVTATGTSCGTDPGSGITLCLGSSACPAVLVDPDQLPGCGYRISGNVIDLECLCDDSLCPVGSAASCADAKALLQDQTSQGVCAQVADGKCTTVSQTPASAGSNTASNCDKDCRDECSGDPGCLTLCGC